jgi:hypothetical protein
MESPRSSISIHVASHHSLGSSIRSESIDSRDSSSIQFNIPAIEHRSISDTVYDIRRAKNRFRFMPRVTRSVASGYQWVVSHVRPGDGANVGAPHEFAALADNRRGMASLTTPQIVKMLKELHADVWSPAAGDEQIATSLRRVQNLVAALPHMSENIPSPKVAYNLITDMLHKLDKTNAAHHEAGQAIMNSLSTTLRTHFIADSAYRYSHDEDPPIRSKWKHQKQIVKLIVRNAPDFFDANNCERLICGLIGQNLHASSASRQYDGWGALVRELGKNLHRYPVKARMEIAAHVMKNLLLFPDKPPAGHRGHHKWAERTMVSAVPVGMGLALTSFLVLPLFVPLFAAAMGAGGGIVATGAGIRLYGQVRNQFRDSIRELAFSNVVLGALHNDPKSQDADLQITGAQSAKLFARLHAYGEYFEGYQKMSRFGKAVDDIFQNLHHDWQTEIVKFKDKVDDCSDVIVPIGSESDTEVDINEFSRS